MTIKFIGLSLICICLLSFIASILIYAANRKKYYKILEIFLRRYEFPAPYSFHCHTGFFGATLLAYFFIGLDRKKKVFFLESNSEAYSFFEKNDRDLIKWMPAFFYTSTFSFVCCALIATLGGLLALKHSYFP